MADRSSELTALYAEHAKEVTKLVLLLGVTPQEAEDVTQDVFLAAHRTLAKRDNPNRRAWLFTIAHNAVRAWRRKRKRRPEWSNSADEGAELVDARTAEIETEARRRFHDACAFLLKAIPNEDRLAALVLHEACGLTLKQVAEVTGVSESTAKERLKLARRDLAEARARMSDEEREKLRATAVPFASVDEILDALRTPADEVVTDEEVARGWERLAERIAVEVHPDPADGTGGSDDTAPGHPPSPPPELGTPPGNALTGAQLARVVAGVYFAGAVSGVAALYAVLSHSTSRASPIVAIEAPVPVPAPQSVPEPVATASATATAIVSTNASTSAAPPAMPPNDTGPAWEADALLNQARAALEQRTPARALQLAYDHASRFPRRTPGRREEVVIRALVDLDQRAEAEARAARLVRSAPQMRPVMEALFGHPLM